MWVPASDRGRGQALGRNDGWGGYVGLVGAGPSTLLRMNGGREWVGKGVGAFRDGTGYVGSCLRRNDGWGMQE